MSPTLLETWPQVQAVLQGRIPVRNTLLAILDLRSAPLLQIARLTGQTAEHVSEQLRQLEQVRLVEGIQKDDPFEAYYRVTPQALQLEQMLLKMLR